jgi:hypothetical protein
MMAYRKVKIRFTEDTTVGTHTSADNMRDYREAIMKAGVVVDATTIDNRSYDFTPPEWVTDPDLRHFDVTVDIEYPEEHHFEVLTDDTQHS